MATKHILKVVLGAGSSLPGSETSVTHLCILLGPGQTYFGIATAHEDGSVYVWHEGGKAFFRCIHHFFPQVKIVAILFQKGAGPPC